MQWPPRPGPGLKDMKPNGLVAAASTTSHTSMSMRSQSCASSLTSAMLTERKMFSSSFVSSAASGVETTCTSSIAFRYSAAAASVDAALMPPTIFGVVFVVNSRLPGSTRSGENARWKSVPAFRPLPCSSSGCRISRVVPGYVVDSRTTTCPSRTYGATLLAARSMYDRSGSRWGESGVGTAMRMASASRVWETSVVAVIAPESTCGFSVSDGTSSMWLSPRLIASTSESTTSTSKTFWPASANVCASGSPT